MERAENQPEPSVVVGSILFGLLQVTLFGWFMYRGSYVAAFVMLISLVAVEALILQSRWDWSLVLRHGGDERQKRVADRAGRITFLVLLGSCLLGASFEMGTGGDPGTFALLAGIAIAAYLVSVAVLVRRS